MPNFITIEQSQYQRMPWKNGLGETLEIHRHEDNNGLRFRISQASVVENGVFSDFTGLHRTLVLLSGNGMTLEHKREDSGDIHAAKNELKNRLDMACFDGSDKTLATLKDGVIEDLNIMVRNNDTMAKVIAGIAPATLAFSNEKTLLTGFYANEETLMAFQVDQTEAVETVSLSSQSFICFKPHTTNLNVIEVIRGSGVLIEIKALY